MGGEELLELREFIGLLRSNHELESKRVDAYSSKLDQMGASLGELDKNVALLTQGHRHMQETVERGLAATAKEIHDFQKDVDSSFKDIDSRFSSLKKEELDPLKAKVDALDRFKFAGAALLIVVTYLLSTFANIKQLFIR